jgi:hypothetical protein
MRSNRAVVSPRVRGRLSSLLLLPAVLAGGACSSLLEVENPNNVKEEDLTDPRSATALANGALSTLASAYAYIMLDEAATSDELRWVGSRDAYLQLDQGNTTDPNNEFTDATFPQVGQARWWADEAIKRLEAFNTAGTLTNKLDLGRSYLYAGAIYTIIADHFDDFVISSDRKEAGTPVGETNMATLYDKAVAYVDKGLAIARAATGTTGAGLELQLLAMRARANFQKGVWAKVNPAGTIAANPLVNSTAAETDAKAFLAKTSDMNWRWAFAYSATSIGNNMASWTNSRLEFRQGNPYVVPTSNDKDMASVKLTDIIDVTRVSPRLETLAKEFDVGQLYPPVTAVSAREMHLILAETELAKGSTSGFATHINHIRAADGLTAYDPTNAAHPQPQAMLVHTRQTNLYLQGRRLTDHYRFKVPSVDWLAGSEAVLKPGSYFPITRIERDANPNVK